MISPKRVGCQSSVYKKNIKHYRALPGLATWSDYSDPMRVNGTL